MSDDCSWPVGQKRRTSRHFHSGENDSVANLRDCCIFAGLIFAIWIIEFDFLRENKG